MNIDFNQIVPVQSSNSYTWNLRLTEFNGNCRIYYSTNCPLLAQGHINLCTTDGYKWVSYQTANPSGGYFDTDKPWGTGWYAQWVQQDAHGKWIILTQMAATKN